MRSSWVLRRLRPLLEPALEGESRWLPRIRRVSSLARPSFVSPTTMAIAESFSSTLTVSADPRNFITRIRPLMLFSTVASSDESDKEGWDMEWEEEECVDPQVGDGGDGGGVVLGDVGWGARALSAAQEVLLRDFGSDIVMFAFKVSPKGYIYVRLDKLSNEYGCPSIEEIKKYNSLYKKRLDELGERGELPADLALEVSSPGAERLLRVPEDLDRFKEMPMWVQYHEAFTGSKDQQEKDGVFMIDLIDTENKHCVWKLANVRENKGEAGKGRPLSRKQKDWRLKLPFEATKKVMLYLN
ncbi:Ribosome maturation factor RimP protein [Dioscorea alata]|uniref:Ribosome maturation factor RimP protein n=2 Tax=Dioscorea alata TaxID=55571 RepID=A0ACB7VMA7_DIOAL|nr:Ribosome maturation factor RimP protein [Dioscorea alata]